MRNRGANRGIAIRQTPIDVADLRMDTDGRPALREGNIGYFTLFRAKVSSGKSSIPSPFSFVVIIAIGEFSFHTVFGIFDGCARSLHGKREEKRAAADLILVTHQHHDHNCIDLPKKAPGCVIFQNFDAWKDGEYQVLELDFGKVEAVPAYNHHHRKEECVGYIVTVDGLSVYFAGDTGRTEEMSDMAGRHLSYAVLPMDATYTMDVEEAIDCAERIGARYTIPVHMAPGKLFDPERAKRFQVRGARIMTPGESIRL